MMPDKEPGSLLRKHYAELGAAIDAGLSSCDRAVFTFMLEHANSQTWICWPGLTLLALETGRTQRNVVRSVGKLVSKGYVSIVKHGTRMGMSNTYRILFKGIDAARARVNRRHTMGDGSDANVTSPTDSGVTTGVVTKIAQRRDKDGTLVVTELSQEPNHQPEHEARVDEVGLGPSSPTASAGTSAPKGASPAPAKSGGLQHEWFWSNYPKKQNAAAADALLTALLADGADRVAILAGVIGYAAYVKAKRWPDDKFVAHPKNWLQNKRWLDDFTVFTPFEKATSNPSKAKTPANAIKRGQEAVKARKASPVAGKPQKVKGELLSIEEVEAKRANTDARRAEKLEAAQKAEAQRKQIEVESLARARQGFAGVRQQLAKLGGRPSDHAAKIFSRWLKNNPASCSTDVQRRNTKTTFVLAFGDNTESVDQFVAVFGDTNQAVAFLVDEYVASELIVRAAQAPAQTADPVPVLAGPMAIGSNGPGVVAHEKANPPSLIPPAQTEPRRSVMRTATEEAPTQSSQVIPIRVLRPYQRQTGLNSTEDL